MKGFVRTPVGNILLKFLVLMLIYTLLRVIFLAFNYDLFPPISGSEYFQFFLVGSRFDAMTLVIINVIWILITAFPSGLNAKSRSHFLLNAMFVLLNSLALIASMVDVIFYRFNMKRMSSDVFGLMGVLPNLMSSFIKDFWYLFVAVGLVVALLIWLCRFKVEVRNKKFDSIAFIFLFLLLFIGFRGGWQRKPLRPLSAAEFVSINHTPIVLNSAFTMIKSMSNRDLDMKKYFSENELDNLYTATHVFPNAKPSKRNIVIIILESFSKEFIHTYNPEYDATPFLDSLIQKSTSFKNSFANGRRSSEALVSILAGLPNLMDDPYLHSNYADTTFKGLGSHLKDLGFETYFFNGSFKATLGWVDFILASGINHHLSRESYHNEAHSDGEWGIYDDYMLDYFGNYPMREPFLAVFFSLSSHHPYKVRSELPFKKFKNEFINSVSYTDYALGEFFKNHQNKPWFKNSVFIITADHSPGAHSIKAESAKKNPFKNKVGMYKVPILIYDPQNESPRELMQAVQHVDIMPTLLHLAGLQKPFYSFGEDMFEKKSPYVYQYANGIFQILDETFVLFFDGEKKVGLFNYHNDEELKDNLLGNEMFKEKADAMEGQLKAYIQRFNRDLLKNELRPKN